MYETETIYSLKAYKITGYTSLLENNFVHEYTGQADNLKNVKTYAGYITKFGQKRIERILIPWLTAINVFNAGIKNSWRRAEHKNLFITLTLSTKQTKTDKYIKQHLLKNFLRTLQYNKVLKYYLWKAEKQNNGNIHFHIVVDTYIKKEYIQKLWNKLQIKYLGIDDYTKKYKNINPPSTDIHNIRNANKSVNYILKEITKRENKEPISGKVYDLHKSLNDLKPFTYHASLEFVEGFNEFLKENVIYKKIGDYFCYMELKNNTSYTKLPPKLFLKYIAYYQKIYLKLYPETSPELVQVSNNFYRNYFNFVGIISPF